MKSYEMVETLSNKAHVSLEQAKEALERSNWDILDAAIYLERQKADVQSQRPQDVGTSTAYYVSGRQLESQGSFATPGFERQGPFNPQTDFNRPQGAFAPPPPPPYKNFPNNRSIPPYGPGPDHPPVPPYKDFPRRPTPPDVQNEPVGEFVGKLAGLLETVVNHIFGAHFVVKRHDAVIFTVPMLIFLIAILALWWAVVPLLVLGLAFECKYSLGVKGKDAPTVSEILDNTVNGALNTAEKAKQSLVKEAEIAKNAYEQSKKEFSEDFKKGRDSVIQQNGRIDLTKKDN